MGAAPAEGGLPAGSRSAERLRGVAVEEIERSAASVEEAIEAALVELGVTEQEALIEVVQEPHGGFLGLASRPAIVRVKARDDGVPPAGESTEQVPEEDEEGAAAARSFLEGLLDIMGLDADVEILTVGGVTYADVLGAEENDEMALLIGRHGHTLDALQELVRAHVQNQTEGPCRLQVDVEDYRKRRLAQVAKRARDAARTVRRTGRPERLEPMSAFERKVVHDAVAAFEGLETASEGEEPNRSVVVRRRHAGP
jgi:spoIIIJ-associated protein